MYYDKIISIGSDCSVAGSLRNLKYKDATYPFDWCVSKISFILDCFDSDFLCYENIFNKISNLKESGNGYIQYNDKIFFHHEVKYKNLNDKLLLFYKNKYNKRIDRFRKFINRFVISCFRKMLMSCSFPSFIVISYYVIQLPNTNI